ncbi:MAG: TolC family protein [Proteobacteria bacterium]|nr:TolC family protein [Pseudomonadota bacterium]MBU0966965.1 TolC family protein [Pseudomonadota bacterium]
MVTASCTSVIKEFFAPIEVPGKFSATGTEVLADRWWLALQDENLNQLIAESLSGNLTLRMAWDRLEQARAVARKSGADLLPSLDGTAEIARQTVKTVGTDSDSSSTYSLGLAASYEIDLWGRVRAGWRAAEFDLLASQEDLRAAAITLSADVATVWYQLLEQRQQLALLQEQIKINEKYLELVTSQFRNGQARATDVLQQRQILEASRGELINARTREKLLEYQLAILIGKAPGNFAPPAATAAVELPPMPDTGLPAQLMEKRPDIRKAYYQVQASDQRLAVAIAARFPRISLSANAETSDSNVRDLFDNWLANLAGNLTAPLFDGGRRAAEVDRTRGVTAEALHNYGQNILTALQEVEDALFAESQQRNFLVSLDRQIVLSNQSMEQTRERYIYGDMDFLRFLTTILNHQSLQRSRISAGRQLIAYRISLYRSLAGGWEMEEVRQ